MSDLGVMEHGDLVAGVIRGQEDSVRAAIQAPEDTKVTEPEVRAPEAKPEEGEPEKLTPFRKGAKPRDDAFARMKQATEKAAQERTRAEAAEARAAAAEARAQELEARSVQPPVPRVQEVNTPKVEAKPAAKFVFEPYEKYLEAHPEATWEEWDLAKLEAFGEWRESRAAEVRAEKESAAEDDKLMNTHKDRVTAVVNAKTYPDWQPVFNRLVETITSLGVDDLPKTLKRAILSSEQSAHLVYFLGTHPQEAVQYVKESADLPLTATRFLRESLERHLGAGAASTTGSASPPKQSRATPPPSPVSGSPTPAASGWADLSPDEHIARYKEQERSRRR